MGHQKTSNLLNGANDSKFVTRKWNIINDNSKANYVVGNEIIYKTKVLWSNICDYNDVYILLRGDIAIENSYLATKVAFTNWAVFTKCITKIDKTAIDDAESLGLVMPMYNSAEYSSNYSKTTVSLWFYSEYETNNFNAVIANTNNFESFIFKTKSLENTEVDVAFQENATTAVPLKYLITFWKSLEILLTNWKVQLKLKFTMHYVLSVAGNDNHNDRDDEIISTIKDTKLHVLVVTLSARDNQKLWKLPSTGFETLVYWNQYKTKSENKNTTGEYRYFLEPNFVGVNRLFVLVYLNRENDIKRTKTQ